MKILYLSVVTIIIFSGTNLAFAQELVVKPPLKMYGGDRDTCTDVGSISMNATSDLDSNYVRISTASYNGTKLMSSIILGQTYATRVDSHPPAGTYISNSTSFITNTMKNITASDIYKSRDVTLGLTNIGNKRVGILVPSVSSLIVINDKDGRTIPPFDDYSFADLGLDRNNHFIDMKDYAHYVILESGQTLVTYPETLHKITGYVSGGMSDTYSEEPFLDSGNYTMTSVARFLGDVDGQCTMIYLWSKPIDLTIPPNVDCVTSPNYDTCMASRIISHESVPEFPTVIPILLISIVSIIVFYKIKILK